MSAIGTKLTANVRRVDRRVAVEHRVSSIELLMCALVIIIPLIIVAEIQWVAAMVVQ